MYARLWRDNQRPGYIIPPTYIIYYYINYICITNNKNNNYNIYIHLYIPDGNLQIKFFEIFELRYLL